MDSDKLKDVKVPQSLDVGLFNPLIYIGGAREC